MVTLTSVRSVSPSEAVLPRREQCIDAVSKPNEIASQRPALPPLKQLRRSRLTTALAYQADHALNGMIDCNRCKTASQSPRFFNR